MLRARIIKSIRLGDRGINLWDPLTMLGEGEALVTQNCYWRHGLGMKRGSVKHSTTEVFPGKALVGLHRFYYDTTGKALLAVAGTTVKVMNESTGAWTSIITGLTDSTPCYLTTWGAVNKCYGANGVDTSFAIDAATAAASETPNAPSVGSLSLTGYPPVVEVTSATNTPRTPATGSMGLTGYAPTVTRTTLSAAPALALMFVPYRDRLLSIDRTNPSYLRWSGAYDDSTWTTTAQAIRVPGSGAIEAIALHSLSEKEAGVDAMVFVAKATSLYIFSGNDLDPASITYNARLDPIGGGENVGCDAPRTIVSTPKGTIFLGNDHQVYLLPFGSTRIEPIGHHIINQDPVDATKGLESLTTANSPKACAVYDDGLYKLSFATSGSTNNTQYWLDVNRLSINEQGHYGPWYGPMPGMNVSCFANQNGTGDTNKLLGGNAGATGYVYFLNDKATHTDDLTAITMRFTSRHEPNLAMDVRVMCSELELTEHDAAVAVSFLDTIGAVGVSTTIAPTISGSTWGSFLWGATTFAGGNQAVRRKVEYYDQYVVGRMLATSIVYTSTTDRVELSKVEHQAKLFQQAFALRA